MEIQWKWPKPSWFCLPTVPTITCYGQNKSLMSSLRETVKYNAFICSIFPHYCWQTSLWFPVSTVPARCVFVVWFCCPNCELFLGAFSARRFGSANTADNSSEQAASLQSGWCLLWWFPIFITATKGRCFWFGLFVCLFAVCHTQFSKNLICQFLLAEAVYRRRWLSWKNCHLVTCGLNLKQSHLSQHSTSLRSIYAASPNKFDFERSKVTEGLF